MGGVYRNLICTKTYEKNITPELKLIYESCNIFKNFSCIIQRKKYLAFVVSATIQIEGMFANLLTYRVMQRYIIIETQIPTMKPLDK